MAFGTALDRPYFTGTVTVQEVTRYDCALGGHGYMVDQDRWQDFKRESAPMIRQQADTAQRPGETSLNPEGPWRRSVESWHMGAGQSWLDRAESSPFRFNTSKGVDPWTQYGLSLLNAAPLARAATTSNQYLVVAGGSLYSSDGILVWVTGVGTESWFVCSGLPGVACTSLASDGANCYAAFGASGIYKAVGSGISSYVTGTVNLVRYLKGRLIAANGGNLYNPTTGGALPAAFYTHPNAGWTWTDAAEGTGHIYLSGYAGDKSLIYRTAVKADGTALDIPVVAGELPDGELAVSLTGYLGFVVVGTNKGIRFAAADGNGNLTLGALIPTGSPVLCAEGQDRFVWYGLTNYDAVSSGLGRLDLSQFTSNLTPAYASDLMGTGQGSVTAVATYLNKRWFAVAGAGVFKELVGTKVTSGTVTGGRIGFGLPDAKTALFLEVRHDALPAAATVVGSIAVNNGTPAPIGTSDEDGTSQPRAPFDLSNVSGNDFEWTVTITGNVALRAVTLRADPTTDRTTYIYVPVLLREEVDTGRGNQPESYNVRTERRYLDELRDTRRVVTYQEGPDSDRVIVEDTSFAPNGHTRDRKAYQGTYLLKLKVVS